MNTRERFLAAMRFEPCDHPPFWEWAYWIETIQRWYEEGLPRRVGLPPDAQFTDAINGDAGAWRPGGSRERDVHAALGLDEGMVHLPVRGSLRRQTPPIVWEEDDNTRVITDEDGIRKRVYKHRMSMPQFLEFPLTGRRDWEEMKAALDKIGRAHV